VNYVNEKFDNLSEQVEKIIGNPSKRGGYAQHLAAPVRGVFAVATSGHDRSARGHGQIRECGP
jgi:hypothetical protein